MTWETLREKCLPLQVTSLCLEGEEEEIRLQVPQGGGGEEREALRAGLRADGHWRAPEHRQSPPAALPGDLPVGKELEPGLVESQGRAQRGGVVTGSFYPGPNCLSSQRAQRSTFSTRWGHFQLGRVVQWLDSLRGRLGSDCPLFTRRRGSAQKYWA